MTAHLAFNGLHVEFAGDLLGETATAVFDAAPPNATRRFLLTRRWNTSAPAAMCLGANPSKASAAVKDQTVTKLCGFTRRMNYGGFELLNVDARISTDPKQLPAGDYDQAAVDRNDEIIDAFAKHAGPVIVMWGAIPEVAERARKVAARLISAGVPLLCFGTTKSGQPWHPSRRGYDTPLVPYRPELAS